MIQSYHSGSIAKHIVAYASVFAVVSKPAMVKLNKLPVTSSFVKYVEVFNDLAVELLS